MKRDFYEVLEVGRSASGDDIKRAYRKKALKYHPDRNPGDKDAENNFKEASAAYQILSDPDRRATYDRFGAEGIDDGAFSHMAPGGGGFGSASRMALKASAGYLAGVYQGYATLRQNQNNLVAAVQDQYKRTHTPAQRLKAAPARTQALHVLRALSTAEQGRRDSLIGMSVKSLFNRQDGYIKDPAGYIAECRSISQELLTRSETIRKCLQVLDGRRPSLTPQ